MMVIEEFKISANIRNYLEEHKEFVIGGVGKFIFSRVKASFMAHSGFVLPPGKQVVFLQGSFEEDPDFLLYLANKNAISEDQAISIWVFWKSQLMKAINHSGYYHFSDFGKLVNKGSEWTFEADLNFISRYDYALPELKLTPLKNTETKSNKRFKSENHGLEKRVKKGTTVAWLKIAWDILGTAAIFTLLIIGYYAFKDSIINPPVTDSEISGVMNNTIPLNSNPATVFMNEPENEEENQLIPGIIKEEEQIASCALILGSFTKERNASRMQRLIMENGYELYTEQYQEFIRIGISVPCDKVNGKLFKEIEQKVGIDPWLRIYAVQ